MIFGHEEIEPAALAEMKLEDAMSYLNGAASALRERHPAMKVALEDLMDVCATCVESADASKNAQLQVAEASHRVAHVAAKLGLPESDPRAGEITDFITAGLRKMLGNYSAQTANSLEAAPGRPSSGRHSIADLSPHI